MNELRFIPIVKEKFSNLVHKQTFLTTFFYFLSDNTIIVQVRYITTETKEVACIGYIGLRFRRKETHYTQ